MEKKYSKIFVPVSVDFSSDGIMKPLCIRWQDGACYDIDRILDMRPAASLKAGGSGLRYTCRIRGKDTFLFFEEGRWFVEGKNDLLPEGPCEDPGI